MKRGLIFALVSLMLIQSYFLSAAIFHQSSGINITVDGIPKTLESLIGSSIGDHVIASTTVNPGHNANEIWVSVQDGETTLLNALTSSSFLHKLCPPLIPPVNASDYKNRNIPNPSHLAIEIQLTSGNSLQEAINAGNLCDYSWYTNTSSCNVTCAGGTLTSYCRNKLGVQVADGYCSGTKPSVSCNTQACVWKIIRVGPSPGCNGCSGPMTLPCTQGAVVMCCDYYRMMFWGCQ